MSFQPRGIKVSPRSAKSIANFAYELRKKFFKVKDNTPANMSYILEIGLTKHIPNYSFEVLEDELMDNAEALTEPDNMRIILSSSTYAALDDPTNPMYHRARFTAAHELGHLIYHEGVALHRNGVKNHKPYEDSEWQADTFSAEFLAPISLCQGKSVLEIQETFGISRSSAEKRYTKANTI